MVSRVEYACHLQSRVVLFAGAKPVRIEVVSMDWKWLFIYPDLDVAAVNDLVVPTGAPLEFTLTSATVMNAFFVPQLGSQIYTMPGMTTHLNLLADRDGDYPGFSSHFSGDGFSGMRFMVHAVNAAQFAAWAKSTRTAGRPLDAGAYAAALNARRIPGVRFAPAHWTPAAGFWKGRTLSGVEIDVTDPQRFPSVRTAVELMCAARGLGVLEYHDTKVFDRDWGTDVVRRQLQAGAEPDEIVAGWSAGLAAFARERARVLLY